MNLKQYHTQLCQEWGYAPDQDVATGYEHVDKNLRSLSKQAWDAADEAGKLAIEAEVFDIYRSVGRLPITYYTLAGCRQEIQDLASKVKNIEDRTLAIGASAGQALGRFWFPNMQDANWNDNDAVSLRSRFNHDVKLRRAIKLCYKNRDEGEKAVLPTSLRRALDLVNGGTIQNFKSLNARAVWEYICPIMFGRVLDFSSGYGGRMMGAMTSRMRYHYTGIDPNTRTFAGLNALGELLMEQNQGMGYEMHNVPSEEFVPEEGAYDAAFSSPPYFNLETYCNEPTQCMNRYPALDSWFEGYVAPTLKMIHRALSKDGVYAVNIADYRNGKAAYEIVQPWIDLSEQLGFRYVDRVDMLLTTRPGVGNDKANRPTKSEGIYIFKK
jgi:hypothetical protein